MIDYIDIEEEKLLEKEKAEENKPLRNRHVYKKRDEEEMERNIEFLYDRKLKRKVTNLKI